MPVPISGKTYPVRAQLYALGARWNGKVWMCPEDKAEAARSLVADAATVRNRSYSRRRGYDPNVVTFRTSSGTFTRCNCEDYPCCGH